MTKNSEIKNNLFPPVKLGRENTEEYQEPGDRNKAKPVGKTKEKKSIENSFLKKERSKLRSAKRRRYLKQIKIRKSRTLETKINKQAKENNLTEKHIPLIKMGFHIMEWVYYKYGHSESEIIIGQKTRHKSTYDRRIVLALKILQSITKAVKYSPTCSDIILVQLGHLFSEKGLWTSGNSLNEEQINKLIQGLSNRPADAKKASLHKYINFVDKHRVLTIIEILVSEKNDQRTSPSGFIITLGIKKIIDNALDIKDIWTKLFEKTEQRITFNPHYASKHTAGIYFNGVKKELGSSVDLISYIKGWNLVHTLHWILDNFKKELLSGIDIGIVVDN